MKIQIIALGVVGTAQAFLSQRFGHDVVGYDIKVKEHQYCTINNDYINDADITFICTPEAVVEEVVQKLVKIKNKGLVVVRSTVPIGTINELTKKYNVHICHNPEFFKEKSSLEEVLKPNTIIIGECCKKHGDLLESFYASLERPVIRAENITVTELVKLSANSYLSVLITFWNEISDLCKKLGVDPNIVAEIVKQDPRISSYGTAFFGQAYGGKCLPKDTKHLINAFRSQQLNPKLFEACESFNNDLQNRKNKGEKIKEKK